MLVLLKCGYKNVLLVTPPIGLKEALILFFVKCLLDGNSLKASCMLLRKKLFFKSLKQQTWNIFRHFLIFCLFVTSHCNLRSLFSLNRPSGQIQSISRNVCLYVCLFVCLSPLVRYRLNVSLPLFTKVFGNIFWDF